MSAPVVVAVAPESPAERAGVVPGDRILAINDQIPRDVIQYQLLVDEPSLLLDVDRGGLRREVGVEKPAGSPLGVEVDSPLFDRVQTCDNHCEFCFIYQLPPGMRRSLYLKDDDYRLSFLYGNFTTLTRFTESDLERVVTERLSPLYVSIHATDPGKRSEMLRNRRGGTSLRWLRVLLDHGIEVHGQVVVCPGVNDGLWLEDTLAGVADRFSDLASLCVVPLGVSRHTSEERMRPHATGEAAFVVDTVEAWQQVFPARRRSSRPTGPPGSSGRSTGRRRRASGRPGWTARRRPCVSARGPAPRWPCSRANWAPRCWSRWSPRSPTGTCACSRWRTGSSAETSG